MIGATVGNYRIVERLGDGGMGAVYRAVDEMLDRDVAIKVLKPELARNTTLIERFRQEAIALARLNHPRIATLHGLERHGASFLMIMEYVRGDTLEAIVQRSGRLAWRRAAELCAAALDALDHAHDKGVVHRDIKPANIMLSSTGAVKVMDFGIARLIGKNRQTQVGQAVGTPMYMAPEQLRGEEVDGRTDLYATGAVLFELITGRMAFEADSDYALMMMQLNDPPPAASRFVADVPHALDAIIARAMAKKRDDRFPNAATFRKALEQLVRSDASVPRHVPPPQTRLATPAEPSPNVPTPSVPPTRLASSSPPATRLAPNAALPSTPTRSWLRDWRPYAAAGVLFVTAGGVARLARSNVDTLTSSGVVLADSTKSATSPIVKAPSRPPVSPPASVTERPRETAGDLLIAPPPTTVANSNESAPTRPRVETPQKPTKPTNVDTHAISAGDEKPTEKSSTPTEPVVHREPSEEETASAIRSALVFVATSLSGRNPVGASILTGAVQDQWTALMREGRISLTMIAAPEIQRRGSHASVEFDASVNVRSPFGANRRQNARFAGELEESGGEWKVVTLRPVGSLALK